MLDICLIMANLSVNSVVLTIVALAIGVVLIGSLLGPIASDVMGDLTALGSDGETWSTMVGIVVVISVLGLIILAVNSYSKN